MGSKQKLQLHAAEILYTFITDLFYFTKQIRIKCNRLKRFLFIIFTFNGLSPTGGLVLAGAITLSRYVYASES
jgi:hypothetical protein